jgi:hypothetical protein
MHVDTFVDEKVIGTLHVNFTDHDPFMFTKDYVNDGNPGRIHNSKDDPYGPHPSKVCLNPGDCQIGPVDIRPADEIIRWNNSLSEETLHKINELDLKPPLEAGVRRTDRLEVFFNINDKMAVKFWQNLFSKDNTRFNVTVRGQVAVGMGVKYYNETRNTTFDCPERKEKRDYEQNGDPYCFPQKPLIENNTVVWMDFGQELTELVMKKLNQPSPVPPRTVYNATKE